MGFPGGGWAHEPGKRQTQAHPAPGLPEPRVHGQPPGPRDPRPDGDDRAAPALQEIRRPQYGRDVRLRAHPAARGGPQAPRRSQGFRRHRDLLRRRMRASRARRRDRPTQFRLLRGLPRARVRDDEVVAHPARVAALPRLLRRRTRHHGSRQPRRARSRRPLGRPRDRPALRAGAQPLHHARARPRVPLLLRPQVLVPLPRQGARRLPRRLRHVRRALRDAHADPDEEDQEAVPGAALRLGLLEERGELRDLPGMGHGLPGRPRPLRARRLRQGSARHADRAHHREVPQGRPRRA